MSRIALVTDSSSDLSLDMIRENNINMVELTSSQFLEKLKTSRVMPKTCQRSPAEFVEVYERLLDENDFVFSIHISSRMSGTVQSARIAAESVRPKAIEVIDGQAVSLVTGLMCLAAAEAIQNGEEIPEVRRRIEYVMENFGLYWTLDTLEYLQKNGRIGRAEAFVGGLLSIKPILSIVQGEISGVERVRGASRVWPRILQLMHEDIPERTPIDVIVLHAADEDRCLQWMDDVKCNFNCRKMWPTDSGPVVGTHAGPGTMAVAWFNSIVK